MFQTTSTPNPSSTKEDNVNDLVSGHNLEESELALLNIVGSIWTSNVWCADKGDKLDPKGWKAHSCVSPSLRQLVDNYFSYKLLIDAFPEENLKIAVSDKPEEVTQKANQWGLCTGFHADQTMMQGAGGGNALYSAVHLDLKSSWEGLVCSEENGVIQLNVGECCTMGQDADGNAWGSYRPSDAPVNLEVRVSYLTGKMNFGELLVLHSKPEGLEPYKHGGFLSMFTGNPPNPMEGYQGYRFIHVKRELSTEGMRPLLGCENGLHQFNGTQGQGLMNINGKGTRLAMTSVAVDRMRGGCKSEKPSGYLEFYQEKDTGKWQPVRSFNCLFEFLVDGKLIYATICDETHSRGADSGDRGGNY